MTTRNMLRRFFVLITFFYCVYSQAFSSIRNLEIIYEEEGKLVEALREYVSVSLTEGLTVGEPISSFLKAVGEARSRVTDVEIWISNPINALHFLTRIIMEWERIMASLSCETCDETRATKDLIRVWNEAKSISNYWPSLLDKEETYKSILRIWNLYDLNHTDILNGKIGNSQTDPLTSKEVMEMLKQSKYANTEYNSVVWLQALSDRRSNTSLHIDKDVSEQDMDFELATAYADYKLPGRVIEIMNKYEDSEVRIVQLRYNNLVRRAYEIPVQYQRRDVTKPKRQWSNDRIQHKRLCQGHVKLAAETSRLKCRYRPTRVALYRVREEVVHESPRISMFHGLISDAEIRELRSRAESQLRQSLTKEEQKHWSRFRVSQSAWLDDSEDQMLTKINQRIKLVTGLYTANTRQNSLLNQYEVVNYGVGGMHINHFDVPAKMDESYIHRIPEKLRIKLKADMDKMATWMFYLGAVEEGGATVFPELRVRVPVTKGSALFWHNMDPSGSPLESLLHAECPVIIGSKWIAKKWFSYDENMYSSSRNA